VRALHAKIKNSRKDQLDKVPRRSKEYGAIFVGKVNASALPTTRMAKSVVDAGRSPSAMRRYKGDRSGVWFEKVDESYSTETCSCSLQAHWPEGLVSARNQRIGLS
jgi:hypothetical protein